MSLEEPLIHIGYHKTASTWLQENLLDNPYAGFKRFYEQRAVREHMVSPNSLDFDAQKVKDYYNSILEDQVNTEEKISVISNERLSGNPHSGGYDSKEVADRLHSVFPNAKILIVIREQKSAILSCYLQYIKIGGPCSIKDYLEPPKRNLPVLPLFDFEHFNYTRLVKYYIKLFGKENVLVVPYELFKENANDFCFQIINFAGAKKLETLPYAKYVNQGISAFSSMLLRQYNKVFVQSRLNPAALNLKNKDYSIDAYPSSNPKTPKALHKRILALDALTPSIIKNHYDKKLKKYIEAKVANRYIENNKELAGLTNTDLSKYGYTDLGK